MGGLYDNLRRLFLPDYSNATVTTVVEYCYKSAYNHCRFKGEKLTSALQKTGLSLRDLCYDAIASLFARDADNQFSSLYKSFLSWDPAIVDDAGASFFLYRVTVKKTEQRITELYAEADHFFFKILTAVTYQLTQKCENKYKKMNYLGRVYIVRAGTKHIVPPLVDTAKLDDLPLINNEINSELFESILNHCEKQCGCFPAIPFNDLIRRLKEIHAPLYAERTIALNSQGISEPLTGTEIHSMMDEVIVSLKEKVDKSYVRKGKLSGFEGVAFAGVIEDLGRDMLDGGPEHNLFNYIAGRLPGTTEIEYKTRYKGIIEYMLRSMRSDLYEKIKC